MANAYGLPEFGANPLLAYLSGRDMNQRAGLADVQGAGTLMGLMTQARAQQREQQMRDELQQLGPNPSQENLAGVAAKYAPAAAILQSQTSSLDRKAQIAATREAASARITQAAQQFAANMDNKIAATQNAQERTNLMRQKDQAMAMFQSAHLNQTGQRLLWETGIDTAPVTPPTFTPQAPAPPSPSAAPGGLTPLSLVNGGGAPSAAPVQNPPGFPVVTPDQQAIRDQAGGALRATEPPGSGGGVPGGAITAPPATPMRTAFPQPQPTAQASPQQSIFMPPAIKALPLKQQQAWLATQGGGATLTPAAVTMAASRYMVDGTLPPNMGRGTQGVLNTNAILTEASQMFADRGVTGEAARVSQLANKSISIALTQLERQRANIMTYEKTALAGADIALEMSNKVDRTGIPIVNRWVNAGRVSLAGDPDVTRLNNAVETFANEYAKVMSGSSGGQATTISMQDHARSMLNGAQTKPQFEGVINLMRREMTQTRETAFDRQIDEMKTRMSTPSSTSVAPTSPSTPKGKLTYDPATGTFK